MKSLRELYKIGMGPSSSHTMGPHGAAALFRRRIADRAAVRATAELYGSLAATGIGHLADKAIERGLSPLTVTFAWHEHELPEHPNGMIFRAFDLAGREVDSWRVYSVGGGCLADDTGPIPTGNWPQYPCQGLQDVLAWCTTSARPIWAYVDRYDLPDVWPFLTEVWTTMRGAITRGLDSTMEVLPGSLHLRRRSKAMRARANESVGFLRDLHLLSSYALAVAEENAAGGTVVTAPTCGSAGVVPAVLYYFWHHLAVGDEALLQALATAGLVGATVAHRASISGALVGCQGEIGTACAMAAAAAAQLLKGSPAQIEYAAEMGMEHWLGLTCDPVAGLVQVPCIERNAFAAMRAVECAAYALATDGSHLVSFDNVVDVMKATGLDLQQKYRETATGGLAGLMKAVLEGQR